MENVNEIEAPGMEQITTRTQSQMTRQLEGDDSSSNGGGRSRKHKKSPEILDPSADIFSEARQHHPELQPDSMSLSILRKSDRWPIILRPSWRFNWIRLSGPTSDARATPLQVDCR